MNKRNSGIIFWLSMIVLIAVTSSIATLLVYGICSLLGLTFHLAISFLSCLSYGLVTNLLFALFMPDGTSKLEEAMKNNREIYKNLNEDDEEDQ